MAGFTYENCKVLFEARLCEMKTAFTDGKISIRLYRPEDAPLLFAAVRESMATMSPWLTWCHPNYSMEDSLKFVQSRQAEWEKDTHYSLAIFDSERGRFLGGVGINFVNRVHQLANLGYWIRSSEVKRGFATRAVRLMAQFAFEELKLQRIEIIVATRNVASSRVAEKAGATREGILRNRLILSSGIHQAALYSLVPNDLRNDLD
jgi:ribosomal-protein-serine acetyltransferase